MAEVTFWFSQLYPVLDARRLPATEPLRGRRLSEIAATLVSAGVTMLQYRNKLDDDARVLEDARMLRHAAPASLRIVLNDRAHLVMASGCDGVHVGQGDMAVAAARVLLGPNKVIGLSTHSEAQLRVADRTSADYLAIGPVYATGSKLDTEPVVGPAAVARARALTTKPLVAIGGITPARAAEVRAAGADSIAVLSALFGPPDRPHDEPSSPELAKLAEDFLSVFR